MNHKENPKTVEKLSESEFAKKISQALAKGVSDHQLCAFDIDRLHFFERFFWHICNGSQFRQHFQTYFWKKSNGNQIEQHFELELLFLF